jgi:hypothetical protein
VVTLKVGLLGCDANISEEPATLTFCQEDGGSIVIQNIGMFHMTWHHVPEDCNLETSPI